ncbi:MAG: hypothetical protein QGI75_06820 [Phycisphaerales bacterium]|nr:hypothetical protein [Phycisphaerales bacterium]MDP6890635.1 hypothetical protein [Phycisphaerales bacterium]
MVSTLRWIVLAAAAAGLIAAYLASLLQLDPVSTIIGGAIGGGAGGWIAKKQTDARSD